MSKLFDVHSDAEAALFARAQRRIREGHQEDFPRYVFSFVGTRGPSRFRGGMRKRKERLIRFKCECEVRSVVGTGESESLLEAKRIAAEQALEALRALHIP